MIDCFARATYTPIYRIISRDRLNQLFKNSENVLVTLSLWDDPFENFFLNSAVVSKDGSTYKFGFSNDYYGQCWSFANRSDALWRIYSADSKSVRIKTTIKKLAHSLSIHHPGLMNSTCFIGRVSYMKDYELNAFSKTTATAASQSPSAILFASTLLKKRIPFEHEQEVRLLFCYADHPTTGGSVDVDGKCYRYSLDPHFLIDQIMLDPRTPKNDANDIKKTIVTTTRFQGEIKRSKLYDLPPSIIYEEPE